VQAHDVVQLHCPSRSCVLVQLNLALVGLLNVSLALEDPFDNQGLDGIYVDEALFEAEQVCIHSFLMFPHVSLIAQLGSHGRAEKPV